MSLDIPNRLFYDEEYDASLNEVLDKFIERGDEFALSRFINNYFMALERLKLVSESDGRPSDKTLLTLGIRRMKIKHSKYIILYTYKNGTIWLHSIQYSGRDFSKLF